MKLKHLAYALPTVLCLLFFVQRVRSSDYVTSDKAPNTYAPVPDLKTLQKQLQDNQASAAAGTLDTRAIMRNNVHNGVVHATLESADEAGAAGPAVDQSVGVVSAVGQGAASGPAVDQGASGPAVDQGAGGPAVDQGASGPAVDQGAGGPTDQAFQYDYQGAASGPVADQAAASGPAADQAAASGPVADQAAASGPAADQAAASGPAADEFTFNSPSSVYADTTTLATLNEDSPTWRNTLNRINNRRANGISKKR